MSNKNGRLYGVGVGPGDPELITMKAARILKGARIITYFTKQGSKGRARAIAAPLLAEACEEMPLVYPVTTEIPADHPDYLTAMNRFYEESTARIATHLEAGNDVVTLCEGDPFFYGSFMHLFRRLQGRFECHVVPGVTAMSGCWTAAGTPMTWGDDTLTVLPGTLTSDVLCTRLRQADAAVIMKIGRHLPKVRMALTEAGMLARAIYIEYGTTENQNLMPLSEKADNDAPYFSLIVVPGEGRRA